MPIRFVDRQATFAGRVTASLANATADFDGTFTAAPARTGAIASQLQNHTSAFTGQFQTNANRTGTLASTLAGHSAAFVGDVNSLPVWQNVPSVTANAGAFSRNMASFVSDPDGDSLSFSIAPNSPSTEAQINAAGLTLSSAGLLSGTYNGTTPLTIIVRATENSQLADWNSRISGQGVVWYHNFQSDSEVNAFRWTGENVWGNDPNSVQSSSAFVTRDANDGFAGGGSLVITRNPGSSEPAGWWRPFSPIVGGTTTGNGRGVGQNDPGAGIITPRSWNPSNRNENGDHQVGYYGHPDHQNSSFDGHDFYIQFKTKISAGRWATSQNRGIDGKLVFIATTGRTPAHELLLQLKGDRRFYMYTGFGSPGPLEFMYSPQNFTGLPNNQVVVQPGGAYDATCRLGALNSTNCWSWPEDEWVTVLIHIIPGHGVDDQWGSPDTGVQMWVARAGATSYTKLYDKLNYQIYFDTSTIGWNAFQCSAYHNSQVTNQAWTQKYTQIIFSRQFIPCPQV